jgi:hypothetical protein
MVFRGILFSHTPATDKEANEQETSAMIAAESAISTETQPRHYCRPYGALMKPLLSLQEKNN